MYLVVADWLVLVLVLLTFFYFYFYFYLLLLNSCNMTYALVPPVVQSPTRKIKHQTCLPA